MPIRVFHTHYQLVYTNSYTSSFSLISYTLKVPRFLMKNVILTYSEAKKRGGLIWNKSSKNDIYL